MDYNNAKKFLVKDSPLAIKWSKFRYKKVKTFEGHEGIICGFNEHSLIIRVSPETSHLGTTIPHYYMTKAFIAEKFKDRGYVYSYLPPKSNIQLCQKS